MKNSVKLYSDADILKQSLKGSLKKCIFVLILCVLKAIDN